MINSEESVYSGEYDAPYRKSSKRSKPKKEKHKHNYCDCIVECYSDKSFGNLKRRFASYCSECGKLSEFKDYKGRLRRFLDKNDIQYSLFCGFVFTKNSKYTSDDLYEEMKKYMPVFEISSFDQKYVPIVIEE